MLYGRLDWGGWMCPAPLPVWIYGRLGSRAGGLRCNSTRQNVWLKWLRFISWTLPRGSNSGNCFAAAIQAYQSAFIDSSCHCLTATKNPLLRTWTSRESSESYFVPNNGWQPCWLDQSVTLKNPQKPQMSAQIFHSNWMNPLHWFTQ